MKLKDSPNEQDYTEHNFQDIVIDQQQQITRLSGFLKEQSIEGEKLKKEVSQIRYTVDILKNRENTAFNGFQKLGIFIFKVLTWPFTTPGKYQKLKETPKEFFRDSKNSFSRVVGRILGFI